jgi:Flp pilus assembly CpaF family ATPase
MTHFHKTTLLASLAALGIFTSAVNAAEIRVMCYQDSNECALKQPTQVRKS